MRANVFGAATYQTKFYESPNLTSIASLGTFPLLNTDSTAFDYIPQEPEEQLLADNMESDTWTSCEHAYDVADDETLPSKENHSRFSMQGSIKRSLRFVSS